MLKKIQRDSVYRVKYRKKNVNFSNPFCLSDFIVSRIDDIKKKLDTECKIRDLELSAKFKDCNGIFLVSLTDKMVISLGYKTGVSNNRLGKVCTKLGYKLIYHNFKNSDITGLAENIKERQRSFKTFVKTKAKELESTLPKSEKWFRDKVKQERYFQRYEFKYNHAFRNFIYDVISFKYNVVIEIDGSIHNSPEQIARDIEKDKITATYGFKVIRVKAFNNESYKEAMIKLENEMFKKRKKWDQPRFHKGNPEVILRKAK